MMAFDLIRPVYSALLTLCSPALRYTLNVRAARGKEIPARISERFGITSHLRPPGQVIWIHGASIGEARSAMPLAKRILEKKPDTSVVMTTGTVTSANMLAQHALSGVIHQFIPLDREKWIAAFLTHWKPQCVVWMESEFWPNTLHLVDERKIPLILMNGRISERSFQRWKLMKPFIRGLLRKFSVCLGQSGQDVDRLKTLGGKNVQNIGNLKFAAPPLDADTGELHALQDVLDVRPRWMIASSHPGEEAIACDVHSQIRELFPDVLTIIVPRHAHRGQQIADTLRGRNQTVALRSAGETISSETGIYIADTMGELGLFFRLSNIVLIGKSMLSPGGGQNPIEPAKLSCAILMGPYMDNFREISDSMVTNSAAVLVHNAEELAQTVGSLFKDSDVLRQKQEAAVQFSDKASNVLETATTLILESVCDV